MDESCKFRRDDGVAWEEAPFLTTEERPASPRVMNAQSRFSPDGSMRWYWLYDPTQSGRVMMAVGANPSLANSERTDRTINNLLCTMQQEGCSALLVVNLCPRVDPQHLTRGEIAARHPDNEANVREIVGALAQRIGLLLFFWGGQGPSQEPAWISQMRRDFELPDPVVYDWVVGGERRRVPGHPARKTTRGVAMHDARTFIPTLLE